MDIVKSLSCAFAYQVLNIRLGFNPVRHYYRHVETGSYFTTEQRLEKLKHFINAISDEVEFYNDLRGEFVDQGVTSEYELIAELPLLTKDKIREAGRAILNESLFNEEPYMLSRTGGTTGQPLEVYHPRSSQLITSALTWAGKSRFEIYPDSRGIHIKGFGSGSWAGRLRMRLANKQTMPTMQSGLVSAQKINAAISRFKPAYIEGYVSDLLVIPDHISLQNSSIRVVFTTGEMLYESQRCELSNKFGARVVSYYGSNEINAIAFECAKGRMHVFDQHVILESLNAKGEQVWGEPGEFYVTNLDNTMMPFLRYRIGDMGSLSWETCSCGLEGTIIEELQGRTQDKLVNVENGRVITALYLESKFRSFVSLGDIQLVQSGPTSCKILLADEVDKSSSEINELKQHILKKLGSPFEITIKSVKQVPVTTRGKRSIIRNFFNG